jgi:hypothetical protein
MANVLPWLLIVTLSTVSAVMIAGELRAGTMEKISLELSTNKMNGVAKVVWRRQDGNLISTMGRQVGRKWK